MATAVIDFEPAFLPSPPIEEPPALLAVVEADPEDQDGAPVELGKWERQRRSNLGISILLSAVQDYIGQDDRHHRSAALLLYPQDERYAHHLRWVCDFTDFPLHYLRSTLDRLRPQWNAARQRKER